MQELDLVQKNVPDVPVIVVTGALGDKAAVQCLKRGRLRLPSQGPAGPARQRGDRRLDQKSARNQPRRAGEALRDSEASKTAIFETAQDAIITFDQFGIIRSANPAAERIFGYSPDEILGRNVSILMPEPFRTGHEGYLASYLRTGETKIIGKGREVQGLRRDGVIFPVDLSISEFVRNGQKFFSGVVRDITERSAQRKRRAVDWSCRSSWPRLPSPSPV